MSVVNPSDFLPQLVTWATFNIFATWGLLALLVVTLYIQGFRANPALLSLEAIFILTASTNSALIWTGHARDPDPPFTLCLLNASVTMSNIPFMGGAALCLVVKVWGTAMIIWHPRLRPLMEWIIWTPFLLVFPFLPSIPLFVAGIGFGLKDRTKVFRGSPFYCVLDSDSLQTSSTIFGALFSFFCLVLATWTTIKLLITRRRVQRSRFTEDPNISYAFAVRVILFSVFVGAAFVAGIVALSSSFDAVVPDIVLSSCAVGAFFIFASASPIVRFVFLCRIEPIRSYTPGTSSTVTGSRSGRSGHGTQIEQPQEYILSTMNSSSTDRKAGSPAFFDTQIHISRQVEIREDKVRWDQASEDP
ncbi:hypothetical protein C8R43DRAFT_1229450 [Mycena crocata]|nr:hypothetical protein C8R43DRAFT_1229450 [Mycena crocata]